MRWALVPVIGIGVALAAAAIVAAGRAVASRRRAPSDPAAACSCRPPAS